MSKQFDVLVIGGGPGGYIAAIRASQLGFSAACAESNPYADPKGEPRLGGTCLNVGCIPSKALLHTSHLFEEAGHSFEAQGIKVGKATIDVPVMKARKDGVVNQLTSGIKMLLKKNKVTFLAGHGSFVGKEGDFWKVKVGAEEVLAKQVIVATGSKARHLPNLPVDQKIVMDNEGALNQESVPKKLAIIGAGVIGLEMGSVWRRVGSEVTILEAMPDFLAAADVDVAKEAQKLFTKQGLNIQMGVKIGDIKATKKSVSIAYTDKDGKEQKLDADRLIVSIGRVPNTDGLNAEAVGLQLDERGFVAVDGHCKTNLPGIWAIGDVVRGPMLAHKAMEEGMMAVERIHGEKVQVNYDTIISVIYTHPEIAWVGLTEEQAKAQGIEVKSGQFSLAANGRALAAGEGQGFVKVVADAKTDRLLGMHVVSAGAGDIVHQGMIAMEFVSSIEDLQLMTFAHPTISEAVHEAVLSADGRAIHAIQRKRK